MEVKCVRILDCYTGETLSSGRTLRVRKTYLVLEIMIHKGAQTFIRIDTLGEGTPSIEDLNQFEVVDSAIPPEWIVRDSHSHIDIGPAEWLEPTFWEKYFDGESGAVATYHRILSDVYGLK